MNNSTHSWMDQLEALIQEKHMLKHPFYQAWTCDMLSKETLQEYAKEYYHHVKAFPTYLSALHSRCEDIGIRKNLLSNLMDEEAGSPNHPDLWKAFALALGVSEQELHSHKPSTATQDLVNTFRKHCTQKPLPVGVATLFCYESQIPEICKTKIDGLKRWYGMDNPDQYRYFSVHETADIEHSLQEKEILTTMINPQNGKAVLKGAKDTLNALWNFLSSFKIVQSQT